MAGAAAGPEGEVTSGADGPGEITAGMTDAAVRARPSRMLRWWSLLLMFSPPPAFDNVLSGWYPI